MEKQYQTNFFIKQKRKNSEKTLLDMEFFSDFPQNGQDVRGARNGHNTREGARGAKRCGFAGSHNDAVIRTHFWHKSGIKARHEPVLKAILWMNKA